ncbi:hypothetical protein [Phaeospirillum tilakii]|uniref:Uncharacterized protein n=1 Tax=Phaeospirillum tilakii TaxID=741673 RepID=A0ABW5C931_9PROT
MTNPLFLLGVVGVMLVFFQGGALAAEQRCLGTFPSPIGERLVPVILTLSRSPVDLGATSGEIRFEEPWLCGFPLQFSGRDGTISTFSFKGAGAGKCSILTMGYLKMQPVEGDRVEVALFGKYGQKHQAVILQCEP